MCLSKTLTTIPHDTFSGRKKLRRMRLFEGLSAIEGRSFRDAGIEEIIIPASV